MPKYKKVIDPETGRSRFVEVTEVNSSVPVNREKKEKKTDELYCKGCDEIIRHRTLSAMGGMWHPDCFSCVSCNRQFEVNCLVYTVENDKPYCQRCMRTKDEQDGTPNKEHNYIDPKTGLSKTEFKVSTRISGNNHQYGNANAEPTSLADLVTGNAANEASSVVNNANQVCTKCNGPITTVGVGTSHGPYHAECFVCGHCGLSIDSGSSSYKFHQGKPHHIDCYKKVNAPPCSICGDPAFGRVYTSGDTRFHVACFVCTQCNNSLSGGFLKNDSGKYFCSSNCKRSYVPPITQQQHIDNVTHSMNTIHVETDNKTETENDNDNDNDYVDNNQQQNNDQEDNNSATNSFCTNCGAAVSTTFCGSCGQQQ